MDEPPPSPSDRLITAAVVFANQSKRLAQLDFAELCSQESVDMAAARNFFESDEVFYRELLSRLMLVVRDEMLAPLASMNAGIPRLIRAINSYLDAQLDRPLVRELMLALRRRENGADFVRSRIAAFNVLIAAELRSLSWPHPDITARLLVAVVIETATIEFERGEKSPEARAICNDYLESR